MSLTLVAPSAIATAIPARRHAAARQRSRKSTGQPGAISALTQQHRTGAPDQTLRKLASTAFLDPEHLVNAVRRGLREIQHRPLIDGVLAETGLTLDSDT